MGNECSPSAFMGTGMEKIFSHGDGDGKVTPDREIPADISFNSVTHRESVIISI
jgi:hypothetical protein